jgi:hypothetical protein
MLSDAAMVIKHVQFNCNYMKVSDHLTYKTGLTGNRYAFSTDKEKIKEVCSFIEKSENSIYWSAKYKCWAIRVKGVNQKKKFDMWKFAKNPVHVHGYNNMSTETAKAIEKMCLLAIDQSSQGLI